MTDWLDEHLETFVRPRLGLVPNIEREHQYINFFTEYNLKSLKKLWETAKTKAKGKTIFLPGRDVFLFHILASIEGDHPWVFRPEISGPVAGSTLIKENYSDHFGVDSGYSGSVLKKLNVKDWGLVSGQRILCTAIEGQLCGPMEGCPKYWTRGQITGGRIVQNVVAKENGFYNAASLTRHIGTWFQRELSK